MNNIRFFVLLWLLQPAVLLADTFDARLDWAGLRIVSAPVEGVVSEVLVRPGQRVSQGELLLQLHEAPHRYRLQQAQAAVDAIAPQRADALREKNDAEALYEQTVLSDVELQAAQIRYRQLDAEWRRARAALMLAQWRAGWTRIKAQQDALVIASEVAPGQVIAGDMRSKPLLWLASSQAMLAVASAPVSKLAALQPGEAVRVEVNGKQYDAVIQQIDLHNIVDGKVKIAARFETNGSLIAGQPATLTLP